MAEKNYFTKNVRLLSSIYDSSVKDIIEKLGVSRQHYSLMIRGDSSMKLEYAIKISEHLGVDLETLVKKDLTPLVQDFLQSSFNINGTKDKRKK